MDRNSKLRPSRIPLKTHNQCMLRPHTIHTLRVLPQQVSHPVGLNTIRATATGSTRHRSSFNRVLPDQTPDLCPSTNTSCPVLSSHPTFLKPCKTSLYQDCRTKSSVTVDTAIRIDLRPSAEVARLYPQEVFLPPEG